MAIRTIDLVYEKHYDNIFLRKRSLSKAFVHVVWFYFFNLVFIIAGRGVDGESSGSTTLEV